MYSSELRRVITSASLATRFEMTNFIRTAIYAETGLQQDFKYHTQPIDGRVRA